MKVIVISKRMWIGILTVLLLLGIGLVIYFSMQGSEKEPTAPTMAAIDSYELNAIPAMSRLVPVYRVSRDDKTIAEKAVHEYSDYCDSHKNVIMQAYLSKRDEMEERVQLRLSTYRAMNTQLEAMQAKVQECTPAFTTLKSASVPVKPAGPKRMIFVGVMLVLSTFVTALYAARHVIRQK